MSTRVDAALVAIEHIGKSMAAIADALKRVQRDTAEANSTHRSVQRDLRDLRARVEALEKKAS
jgi:hypothetical protein